MRRNAADEVTDDASAMQPKRYRSEDLHGSIKQEDIVASPQRYVSRMDQSTKMMIGSLIDSDVAGAGDADGESDAESDSSSLNLSLA